MNVIVIAISDPTKPRSNDFQLAIEIGFFGAYVLEMILKILGLGLFSYRRSYLRDPWNVLDLFVIIATSISIAGISLNSNSGNPIYFSSLKIISPLRTIKIIPKLRTIIRAILESLPSLLDMLKVIMLVYS